MQQQNDKKYTDGGRLESLKKSTGKKWMQIAGELGISRSMLFSVLAGDKRLGRDNLAILDRLERENSPPGIPTGLPTVDGVREERADTYGTPEMLRAENAELRAELKQAMETISNLSKSLARRDAEGRAEAAAPKSPPITNAESAPSGGSRRTA